MSGKNVAIRYTHALYEVAAKQQILETVGADLARLDQIMTQAVRIREYCLKKHANRVLEIRFIEEAFIPYISQITAGMLKIAVRNGRLAALPYFFNAWKNILDEKSQTMEVVLESVRPIEINAQNNIKAKMQKRIGKQIKLYNIIVPELLGGMRILWNNQMIDLSAIGRLKTMRTLLRAV